MAKSKAATAAAMTATVGSKAAAKAAEADTDFTVWATKPATDLQKRFGPWILDKVGIEFGTKKELDAFLEGVRLSTALRIPFQASPENQAARAEKAAEEKPVKATKAAASKLTKATTSAAVEEPTPAPAKAAGRKAAKKAAPTEALPF